MVSCEMHLLSQTSLEFGDHPSMALSEKMGREEVALNNIREAEMAEQNE